MKWTYESYGTRSRTTHRTVRTTQQDADAHRRKLQKNALFSPCLVALDDEAAAVLAQAECRIAANEGHGDLWKIAALLGDPD